MALVSVRQLCDVSTSSTTPLSAALQETLVRHVAPGARLTAVRSVPLRAETDAAALMRHHVTFERADGTSGRCRLITKRAHLVERRVLARLAAQGFAGVPYSYAPDLNTPGSSLVALQDLGTRHRPTSLSPIDPTVANQEARRLAAIHAANVTCADTLAWLPRTDHAYFDEMINRRKWRPAWEWVVQSDDFVREFGEAIPMVEAAAARIVDEMTALAREPDAMTLVHADLNPGNVLITRRSRGRPGGVYFIDWDTAHYGTLYVDLPHHMHTLDRAEPYRRALAVLGVRIPASEFAERYRTAARYTALRYMEWTLEAWHRDRSMAVWVRHYLSMLGAA